VVCVEVSECLSPKIMRVRGGGRTLRFPGIDAPGSELAGERRNGTGGLTDEWNGHRRGRDHLSDDQLEHKGPSRQR